MIGSGEWLVPPLHSAAQARSVPAAVVPKRRVRPAQNAFDGDLVQNAPRLLVNHDKKLLGDAQPSSRERGYQPGEEGKRPTSDGAVKVRT